MNKVKILPGYLSLICFCTLVSGLVLANNSYDDLDDQLGVGLNSPHLNGSWDDSQDSTMQTVIRLADSTLACGIYYEYMVGGMRNNPRVPEQTIQVAAQKSESLLGTADQLYLSAGISTQEKYDAVMLRAKAIIQENANSKTAMSDLIYERGEQCRLLMVTYPVRLKEVSDLLERI